MPPAAFNALVVFSTLVDALAAGYVLMGGRHRDEEGPPAPIGLGRVLLAAVATGTVFAVKLPFLMALGVQHFGVIRLVYVDLVVLIPLIGLALLIGSRFGRRSTRTARLAAWAGVGMAAVGVYATEIEPFRLRLETASAPVSPRREGRSAVRIAVMTDLQTDRVTDYERGAVDRLMAQQPDVILLPGDVFQGPNENFARELPALRALLGRLSAPGGVYLVGGDVDAPGRITRLAEGTHITPLINVVVQATVGDRRLTIGGVELAYTSEAAREVVRRLESDEGEDDVRILLAHRPDVAYLLQPRSRVDLVVAGHTHGGQFVVPFYGPPMTLSDIPRTIAAGGLHQFRDNAIYVSRGVGCERGQAPRMRFLCPPEITLITLGARS